MRSDCYSCPAHIFWSLWFVQDYVDDLQTASGRASQGCLPKRVQLTALTEAASLRGGQARVYDDKVREFVEGVGLENIGKRLVNNREKVEFVKPEMSLDKLLKYGQFLVDEQARHGPAPPLLPC